MFSPILDKQDSLFFPRNKSGARFTVKDNENLRKFVCGDYGGPVGAKVAALTFHREIHRIEAEFDLRKGQERCGAMEKQLLEKREKLRQQMHGIILILHLIPFYLIKHSCLFSGAKVMA